MYLPTAFADPDPDRCRALIDAHPLAALVVNGAGSGPPTAEHVPLLCLPVEGDGDGRAPPGEDAVRYRLLGHVARANALAQARPGTPVLAVFSGPEHPVSPSWYATKATDPRVVPTWNYAVVHVTGRLTVWDDASRVLDAIGRLTDAIEPRLGSGWRLGDAPADYVARLAQAVVAVEIVVDAFQGKWKLSQNRSAQDRASVAAALDARAGGAATGAAAIMARQVRNPGPSTPAP